MKTGGRPSGAPSAFHDGTPKGAYSEEAPIDLKAKPDGRCREHDANDSPDADECEFTNVLGSSNVLGSPGQPIQWTCRLHPMYKTELRLE